MRFRLNIRAGIQTPESKRSYNAGLFDRIAREDQPARAAIARLVARAAARGVPAIVTINNKAEGCAPESAFRLAQAIVEESNAPSRAAP